LATKQEPSGVNQSGNGHHPQSRPLRQAAARGRKIDSVNLCSHVGVVRGSPQPKPACQFSPSDAEKEIFYGRFPGVGACARPPMRTAHPVFLPSLAGLFHFVTPDPAMNGWAMSSRRAATSPPSRPFAPMKFPLAASHPCQLGVISVTLDGISLTVADVSLVWERLQGSLECSKGCGSGSKGRGMAAMVVEIISMVVQRSKGP